MVIICNCSVQQLIGINPETESINDNPSRIGISEPRLHMSVATRILALIPGLLLVIVSIMPETLRAEAETSSPHELTMYVFMSETCPHCRAQKPFLANLDARHPDLEIQHLEIMTTREHHDLLRNMAALHDVQPGSVPMIFVGGRVWTGDSRQIRSEIADHVEACLDDGCPR